MEELYAVLEFGKSCDVYSICPKNDVEVVEFASKGELLGTPKRTVNRSIAIRNTNELRPEEIP
jgi:hypothetical protein